MVKKESIRKLRRELGLSQTEFAKLSGLKFYQQVSGLESGRRNIGMNLVNKIIRNLASNGFQVYAELIIHVNNKKIK